MKKVAHTCAPAASARSRAVTAVHTFHFNLKEWIHIAGSPRECRTDEFRFSPSRNDRMSLLKEFDLIRLRGDTTGYGRRATSLLSDSDWPKD